MVGVPKRHPYLSDSDKLAADYTTLVRLQSYKWRLLGVPHHSFYNFLQSHLEEISANLGR